MYPCAFNIQKWNIGDLTAIERRIHTFITKEEQIQYDQTEI